MVEYGYMENGVLKSQFLEQIENRHLDKDGNEVVEIVTVEQQVAQLSEEWKPVDVINEERMTTDDDDYVVIPVPYDAGDRITYDYVRKFDKQKVQADIQALKDSLSESDYKITKCYEASLLGTELPYDIAELHAQRQAERDEINQLENML
jgi:hypothetical protein